MDAAAAVNTLANGGSPQDCLRAEQFLASLQASNTVEFVQAMVRLACAGDAGAAAQLAAVALKNAFQQVATLQAWASIEGHYREELKKMMLGVFWSPSAPMRSMMAEVVGIIGSYEFEYGVWSEYFNQIRDAILSDQPMHAKAAMLQALGVAIEAVSKQTQEAELDFRVWPAASAAFDLLENGDPELAVAVLTNVPAILFSGAVRMDQNRTQELAEVIFRHFTRGDPHPAVVDAALEVMDKAIDRMYPFLDEFTPILLGLTEQRLAHSADDFTDSLMIRVLDFWTTLAWWERTLLEEGGSAYSAAISASIGQLVPILCRALTFNTIDDTWTVGKAAAVCLEECALVGRGTCSGAILGELEKSNDIATSLAGDEVDWMLGDALLIALTCAYKGVSPGTAIVGGDKVLDANHPVLVYAMSLLTEHQLQTVMELLELSAEEGGAPDSTRTYILTDHCQLTLQNSAFLLLEEVLLQHAHCLNAQILQDCVTNMLPFLNCRVPQLVARAAWLLYAVFMGVIPTGEMSWWVGIEPIVPELIERLLATAERHAYDTAFARHACYEAVGALFTEGDQQGFRTELKDMSLTVLETLLARIGALVERGTLSDVERLDHVNHICSILYAMAPLVSRLGKHSQRHLHDVLTACLQLGSFHNDEIAFELMGVFAAMASAAEAVKDELATQLPTVFPIVMESLHKYNNESLCNKAIKTVSEIVNELEGDMGIHCSGVLQNIIRAMHSGQLSASNMVECVTAIGDTALSVPKQFKRHCEEALNLLRENLAATLQKFASLPKHRRKKHEAGEDLSTEVWDMTTAVFQAFSCVLQGLSDEEVQLNDEELQVVVGVVTECFQRVHECDVGTYDALRAISMALADCLGLIMRRLENGRGAEEEENDASAFSELLAPLIGAHPLYGHVLAADILRYASYRGVEPSITSWVAGEVRQAERYLSPEIVNPGAWEPPVASNYATGNQPTQKRR